ncbi:hypothetical protein D9615_008784 [Tricholomella constricta]|uniref:Uncharacterized protein n=1 Tax=Tricholomella constricta TaxID=117010 RepID=A0A8H5M2A8_9AGAR|nr:hypothetical protein D9615_008784 [Tricholomella constricta]
MSTSTPHPRPVRKGANTNPGQVVLDQRHKRRTPAQVRADNERAELEAAAAQAKAAAEHQGKIQSTAAIEDQIRAEDIEDAKHATHPDRRSEQKVSHTRTTAKTKAAGQKTATTATEKIATAATGKIATPAAIKKTATAVSKKIPMIPTKNMTRAVAHTSVPASASNALPQNPEDDEDYEGQVEDPINVAEMEVDDISEGAETFPPESTVDTESDGMAISLDEDHDDDEDFDPPVDDNVEHSGEELGTAVIKKKLKKSRVIDRSLRQVINSARDRPPLTVTVIAKCKVTDNTDSSAASETKRAKKANVAAGLRPDWRKHLAAQTISRRSTPATKAADDEEPVVAGEFDEDESPEQLNATQKSKLSVRMKVKIQDVDVGKVKTSNADIATATTVRFKRMPVGCLPFPTGAAGQSCAEKWKKEFKGTAINFAASLLAPFSSNALLHDYVQEWWEYIFDFTMEEHWTWTENNQDAWPAVVEQTSKIITEWRSSIGKDAIAILGDLFEKYEMTKVEIIDWVEEQRGDPGEFRWLYANPDAPKGQKGAFQSDLVLEIFATHLKQAAGAAMDYGLPVGGLALCTAAMERAFELWETGEYPKKKDEKKDEVAAGKKRSQSAPAFGGDEWIARTAGYVALAQSLKEDEQWPIIISKAEAHMPAGAAAAAAVSQPDINSLDYIGLKH